MKSFSIAIASNDGEIIANSHFGDANSFFIFQIFDNGKHQPVDQFNNTARDMDEKHGAEDKRIAVLNIVSKVDFIVSKNESPNIKKIAAHAEKTVIIISLPEIKNILLKIGNSFKKLNELHENKKLSSENSKIIYL